MLFTNALATFLQLYLILTFFPLICTVSLDPADLVSSPQVTLVVFATLRIVTALFLKETLSTAANDAEMVIEDSRRFALQY